MTLYTVQQERCWPTQFSSACASREVSAAWSTSHLQASLMPAISSGLRMATLRCCLLSTSLAG